MGLDSVELIVEVERSFGISFSDEEAQNAVTVGGLYDLVWKHLECKAPDACNSQIIFYRLRQGLVNVTGIDRNLITTKTDMNLFLRSPHRRLDYEWIGLYSKLKLPALRLIHPYDILLNVFAFVTIAVPIIGAIIGIFVFNMPGYWLLLPLVGILITIAISRLLDSQRQRVPTTTFAQLVKEVLILNAGSIAREKGLSRHEMETIVRDIIVLKTGADESEVIPTASFTEDLGVD